METTYRKVSVKERLPKKGGIYFIIAEVDYELTMMTSRLRKGFWKCGFDVHYWLEEIKPEKSIEDCLDEIGALNGQKTFRAYLDALLNGYVNSSSHRIEIKALIIEAIKDTIALCYEPGKRISNAVEFQKWLIKNNYFLHRSSGGGGGWLYFQPPMLPSSIGITAEDLYEQFTLQTK